MCTWAKSLLRATPWLGSSVQGSPGKILEWVAMPYSRGSSFPSDDCHLNPNKWLGKTIVLVVKFL